MQNRQPLWIDGTEISDTTDCYIIAEVGHNHQGSVEKCKELFRVAKECEVDAVKLQKRDNRALYTRAMYDKPYDNENSFGATYGEHREALEFGWDEYVELKSYCREIGLTFFATAFDLPSADFLARLDVPAFKIASGDLKTLPLLRHVAQVGKPMILSTGGATMEDIERAYDAILPINRQICFLQCTAAYPAAPEELNLQVISTLRRRFPELVIGLSDHENGIAMAPAAYVLGARVVEKHFTLNHTSKGTDHAFSLEPIGMRKLVRDLRRTRVAMGSGVKCPLPSEKGPLQKMGKKLVARRPLAAGHVLTENDVAMKSPGDGLPPYYLDQVLGRTLVRGLEPDDSISFEVLSQGEGE
ncbi:MAG: sialic acid synthase [Gemmatimonadales bacterium]|jgi:N-acetylneuraminate synthase/sialic acid synthase|nr:sialic acid synthase [Gemmatimonadales bacterium]